MKILAFLIIFTSSVIAQTTRTVCASECDYTSIQSAVNAANRGDTISIAAGETFTENITLPYKSGEGWITLQSSALASLPAAGNRVSPSDASNMPRIQTNSGGGGTVFRTVSGTNHSSQYRLIGLHIARHPSLTGQLSSLIEFGEDESTQDSRADVPTDLVLDRCYLHGESNRSTRRGLALNAERVEVINSYFEWFWESGADSQAILGWTGTKDVLIQNNYLEGASENVMFGGSAPQAPELIPEDIVLRYNHFNTPLSWIGEGRGKKNLFELKEAKRVLLEYNILEGNWADAQNGWAIMLSVRNDDGESPGAAVEDVTIRYNIIRNTTQGFSLYNADDYATSETLKRVTIEHNLVMTGQSPGSTNHIFQFLENEPDDGPMEDIIVRHNTILAGGSNIYKALWFEGSSPEGWIDGLTFNDNIIFPDATAWSYLARSGEGVGTSVLNQGAGDTWEMLNNVFRTSSSGNPTGNFYPASIAAIGFEDHDNGNFKLASDSTYKGAATDETDPGVNWDALMAYTECVEDGDCGDSPTPTPTPTPSPTPTPTPSGVNYYGNEPPPIDNGDETFFSWLFSYFY